MKHNIAGISSDGESCKTGKVFTPIFSKEGLLLCPYSLHIPFDCKFSNFFIFIFHLPAYQVPTMNPLQTAILRSELRLVIKSMEIVTALTFLANLVWGRGHSHRWREGAQPVEEEAHCQSSQEGRQRRSSTTSYVHADCDLQSPNGGCPWRISGHWMMPDLWSRSDPAEDSAASMEHVLTAPSISDVCREYPSSLSLSPSSTTRWDSKEL